MRFIRRRLSAGGWHRDPRIWRSNGILGEPDAAGMFLRSNWGASHIAGPNGSLTLDAYRLTIADPISAPIPVEQFVNYGRWYQRQAVPNVEKRNVTMVNADASGFKVTLADGEVFTHGVWLLQPASAFFPGGRRNLIRFRGN
jgi:hypothetical protein